jgi:hypothetical protein
VEKGEVDGAYFWEAPHGEIACALFGHERLHSVLVLNHSHEFAREFALDKKGQIAGDFNGQLILLSPQATSGWTIQFVSASKGDTRSIWTTLNDEPWRVVSEVRPH